MIEHPPCLSEKEPVRAVVLAAGPGTLAGTDIPLLLHPLAGRAIVDYVVENALHFVSPQETYVVGGTQHERIQQHIERAFGKGFHYVEQSESLGTGHAVLQTKPYLGDFEGDVLILYGDTPLFRASSIRGLLNRHRLTAAALTLLTAVVTRPLPYGRIIRDRDNRLIDIIEADDASPETPRKTKNAPTI